MPAIEEFLIPLMTYPRHKMMLEHHSTKTLAALSFNGDCKVHQNLSAVVPFFHNVMSAELHFIFSLRATLWGDYILYIFGIICTSVFMEGDGPNQSKSGVG